ncbi:recombinase family protein [Streptomyces sp. Ncost-T10-10d]|uniref:recombinase family protein n=1 Tax=Streptomyces sp. Ncost-T10-10d TaxID=1839774 RepID=UPI00081E0BC9|nr:recombinase family protein [Streptomyces sp. Ncost-T10-10d]SCF94611.1 Site-specific DNA recombinase [Streptomyces sp. Ncost-T10-10d]
MARVLGVIRLSRVSDETTSPERQRRSIQRWADQEGHVVVGWVEDIDVSGGVEPWKRPEFGKWLPSIIGKEASAIEHRIAMEESRADEYDIICALKIDRLSRRVLHVHTLLEWCERNGKEVATVEDGINLNTQMGKLLLSLIASFAEGELEAIKARAKSSYNHLVKEGRWRGGRTPYGYREEKQDTGEGWKLVVDDYGTNTAGTLREIVRRLIEGESANSIAQSLNEDVTKTPTSLDAQMIRSGKTPKGSRWTAANTSKVVRSRCVLGQMEVTEEVMVDGEKVKRRRVVRDAEGQPLQRAEPLITQEEWELANKKLDENTSRRKGNRKGGSPLLRVAFCTCGEPAYLGPGRSWPYYRCASRTTHKPCPTGSKGIAAHTLEDAVEKAFLLAAGDVEIVRKVFRPGVDYTRDIEEVNRALADLREDREAGLYSSELGKQEYRETYKRLDARREQLLAQPTRPDAWEEIPTGETYRERWSKLSTQHEKGKELRAAGVKAVIHAESITGLTAAQLMAPEGHDGMWQHPVERVQVLIPMDFKQRLRNMAAVHSES